MTRWSAGFIGVDWGTTNRRAYLVDPTGRVLDTFEDGCGVLAVPAGGFEAEVRRIVERLGDKPMLLAGMVGSNRGWRDVPYVRCPASLEDLAAGLQWEEPGRAAIIPGLALLDDQRADVMRGEEVQIFGLMAGAQGADRITICHPGTHTKWVRTTADKIESFRTIMTGEMFALLREHSILAPQMTAPVTADKAFLSGVDAGRSGFPLTAELFSARARTILGSLKPEDAASFVSGLLIGSDVLSGLRDGAADEVIVLGRPSLTKLYAAALHHHGVRSRESDGAAAFVAGLVALTEVIG
jgi:2-dehydro-3-deoxygalactonokinase